jgi:HSP20 family protein
MTLLPSLFSRRQDLTPIDVWDNMNRMMNQMFRRFPSEIDGASSFPVDLEETKDSYIIEADLPRVTRNDVEVYLDNKILTITVAKEKMEEKKERNYLIQERSSTSASRSLELPFADDKQTVNAALKDGVLRIEVRKSSKETSHKIEVK